MLLSLSNQGDCFKAAKCDALIITFMLKGASCFGCGFVALSACHTVCEISHTHKFGVDKGF